MEKITVKIDGTGKISQGTYGNVEVNGSGKCEGNMICDALLVNGICKSEADLQAQTIKINGAFKAYGNVKADLIEVDGSFKGEKDVRVKRMIVDGLFKNEEGFLNADYIEVNGSLTNEKEINVDLLEVNGVIKAKDIVGMKVEILKNEEHFSFFGFRQNHKHIKSKAETITCETLFARSLKCTKICADEITLKNGCDVEYVECQGTLKIDTSSVVKNIIGDCEIIYEN